MRAEVGDRELALAGGTGKQRPWPLGRRAEQHSGRVGDGLRDLLLTCRPIAQPHPPPRHDFARHLRRLHHPLSTCCLASRWKEDMAFLRSFYVADDIWRFA